MLLRIVERYAPPDPWGIADFLAVTNQVDGANAHARVLRFGGEQVRCAPMRTTADHWLWGALLIQRTFASPEPGLIPGPKWSFQMDELKLWYMTIRPRVAARAFRPRCGATCKQTRKPCRAGAMKNGRCRYHGGCSTGPKTEAGRQRALANLRQYQVRDAK